jgi:hypothetical protein
VVTAVLLHVRGGAPPQRHLVRLAALAPRRRLRLTGQGQVIDAKYGGEAVLSGLVAIPVPLSACAGSPRAVRSASRRWRPRGAAAEAKSPLRRVVLADW